MPPKEVRKVKIKPRKITRLKILSDGTRKEYEWLYYYMNPQIHIPIHWTEDNEAGELKSYELHKIEDARSFLIIPSNLTERELRAIQDYLKAKIKKRFKKKGGRRNARG